MQAISMEEMALVSGGATGCAVAGFVTGVLFYTGHWVAAAGVFAGAALAGCFES